MTYLIVAVVVSVVINIFGFWYFRKVLEKLIFTSENIFFLKESVDSLSQHLEAVYQLEMYYGDETLMALIEHIKEVRDDISDFSEVYELYDEGEEKFVQEEEDDPPRPG